MSAALSQWITSLPTALQSLAAGATSAPAAGSTNLLSGLSLPQLVNSSSVPAGLLTDLTDWNTIWSTLCGPYSIQGMTTAPGGLFLTVMQGFNIDQTGQGAAAFVAGPAPATGALAALTTGAGAVEPSLCSAGLGGAPVSGVIGKAALVGRMSVPQGWTEAAPTIKTLAAALPANLAAGPAASLAGEGSAFSQMALSSLAGRAFAATATRSVVGAAAGRLGGVVAEADPAAATIIVIPAIED